MTNDKKYNGWTNYETWLCALWLDNSEGDQRYMASLAQEAYDSAEGSEHTTREEQATYDLAEQIEEYVDQAAEEWMPKQHGMFADFVNAGLREICWREMAEHYISDVEKQEEEETAA